MWTSNRSLGRCSSLIECMGGDRMRPNDSGWLVEGTELTNEIHGI